MRHSARTLSVPRPCRHAPIPLISSSKGMATGAFFKPVGRRERWVVAGLYASVPSPDELSSTCGRPRQPRWTFGQSSAPSAPLHHLGRVFVEAQPLRYARQLLLDSDRADQSDALKSNHSHSQYFGSLIRSRAPGCSKSPYRPPEYRGQSSANPASMTKAPMSLPLR